MSLRINKHKSKQGTGNVYYTTKDIEHPIVPNQQDKLDKLVAQQKAKDNSRRLHNSKHNRFLWEQ